MHDRPSDSAAILRRLTDSIERRKAASEPEGALQIIRQLSETHQSSDSVAVSTQDPSASAIGSAEMGFCSWR